MDLDLQTFVIVQEIVSILLVIALYAQYRVNKTYYGIGWWTLGTFFWVLGFFCLNIRNTSSVGMLAIISNIRSAWKPGSVEGLFQHKKTGFGRFTCQRIIRAIPGLF